VRRPLILAVLIALALAASVVASAGSDAACKPGVHTIGQTTYRIFCGPASASVKVGTKTHSFRNGSCLRAGITRVFAMSIGKLTVSKRKHRYSYFGVTVPKANHDGVYRRAVVTWAIGGKRYSLSKVRLRLTNKQTRGSFSGRAGGKKVTGAFRCK
jgi:hypothetical protein